MRLARPQWPDPITTHRNESLHIDEMQGFIITDVDASQLPITYHYFNYCTIAPLYYCTTVLLYYCTTILLLLLLLTMYYHFRTSKFKQPGSAPVGTPKYRPG
jgi:hypothetical protein